MDKKIDIIIPVYKAHHVLGRALDSLKYQTNANKMQVTLVNDCCPEGDYQDFIDLYSPFFAIQELTMTKNSGPGYSRQYGVDNTTCEYFFFLDADDILMNPFGIQMLLETMDDYPGVVMVFAPVCEQNQEGGMVYNDCDMTWVFGRIFRRSFMTQRNIRFITSRSNEDVLYLLLLRLILADIPNSVRLLQQPIYAKMYDPCSICNINSQSFEYDYNFVGYVNSTILACLLGRYYHCNQREIEDVAFNGFLLIWMSYNQILSKRPDLLEQSWENIKKYYNCLKDIFTYDSTDEKTSLRVVNFLKEYYAEADNRRTPYTMTVGLEDFYTKVVTDTYDPQALIAMYGNDTDNQYKLQDELLLQEIMEGMNG